MPPKVKILIVDDQEFERTNLAGNLVAEGFEVVVAAGGHRALKMFEIEHSDARLVITDMQMPEMNGIELTQRLKSIDPLLDVIVVTAQGAIETAVEAIKAGASNYLIKPVKMEEVRVRINRLLERRKLQDQSDHLEKENKKLRGETQVIAQSRCMRELMAQLDRATQTDASILLTGETGTGKEVLARYVHERSKRAKGPFIAINCSAIPENLMESEFFGHEKGAFTGADQRALGLFERADGGTIFLDELGEMDLKLQPKILRALEERCIRRVSGTADIKVDVRIIAATNRDLKKIVEEKRFREDLFFRLNVVQIQIPPLRQRAEDIPALIEHMVKRFSTKMNVKIKTIEDSYFDALKTYQFPGNIRELANIVERSLIYSGEGVLNAAALPLEIRQAAQVIPSQPHSVTAASGVLPTADGPLVESLAAYEKQLIEQKISFHQNDLEKVAKDLKISRSTLYSKLAKHKIR